MRSMTEEIINEIYLLAVKSKLQRGAISVEERLDFILKELNLNSGEIIKSTPPIDSEKTIDEQPISGSPQEKTPSEHNPSNTENLQITNHKYAEQPEDEGFLNRELETELESRHIYEIHLTNNPDIAYYELITDSYRNAEYLRSPSMVPDYVVVFDNSVTNGGTSDAQLVKVKNGVLQKCGKLWKIVEPCHMKWC